MDTSKKLIKILLAEDNDDDIVMIQDAFARSRIINSFDVVKNGEEALKSLCPPAGTEPSAYVPDAILLDLNTPKSDGFEVLIKLKQSPRLARVPIAIITSSQATSDKHRTVLQGTRYIQKPAQLEEFLNTVGKAVHEMLEGSTDV